MRALTLLVRLDFPTVRDPSTKEIPLSMGNVSPEVISDLLSREPSTPVDSSRAYPHGCAPEVLPTVGVPRGESPPESVSPTLREDYSGPPRGVGVLYVVSALPLGIGRKRRGPQAPRLG